VADKATKGSRLEKARQRLERAVTDMESAVEARLRAGKPLDGDLGEALDSTRAENAALKRINAAAAERLDATIRRLRAALEG
jgi:hypothetical protein